jgi:flagellar hook-basal body protein
MQNGLYVSLSAQVALEKRLETIADNIANMNTVGYRGTGVSFETEMAKAGDSRLGYVSSGSDFISRRLGGLTKTDNTLDFAVQGDGWFGIQTSQGTAYTRDGRVQTASRRDWPVRDRSGRKLETSGKFKRGARQAGDADPRFHPRRRRSGRSRKFERRSGARDD